MPTLHEEVCTLLKSLRITGSTNDIDYDEVKLLAGSFITGAWGWGTSSPVLWWSLGTIRRPPSGSLLVESSHLSQVSGVYSSIGLQYSTVQYSTDMRKGGEAVTVSAANFEGTAAISDFFLNFRFVWSIS